MSDTISYSELQATLEACLDKVCEDREPLFVKRKKGGNVVVISSDDYAALEAVLKMHCLIESVD